MATASRFEKHVHIVFILAIAFGLILRFFPDGRSLWLDEIYSVVTAYKYDSFRDMYWGRLVREIHPPLYQIILYYWVGLFGDADYVVRIPSMLAGAALIIIGYFYGRPLLGKSHALLLAALFAVSWGGVYYSHEARSYSLLLLLSAVLMLKSLKLMAMATSIHTRQMIEMLIIGIWLCHTHYFGALLWFSNLIALTYFLKLSRLKVIALAFVSMLAFAPWMIVNSRYIETDGGRWIGNYSRGVLVYEFSELVVAHRYARAILVALILYGLFFWFRRSLAAARNIKIYYSVSVVFLAGFFALLINRLHMPVLTARNMIILLPFLYLIISTLFTGAFRDDLRSRNWLFKLPPVYLSACLVIVMAAGTSWGFAVFEKENWHGSASSIARIRNLDRVFYIGDIKYYWHYLRKTDIGADQLMRALDQHKPNVSAPPDGSVSVLWCCRQGDRNPDYQKFKKKLAEEKLEIVDEQFFPVNGSCAYTVFK